jgi:hypothetical protein
MEIEDRGTRAAGVNYADLAMAISFATEEVTMERRRLFEWLAGIPLLSLKPLGADEAPKSKKLNIMMKSAWGSDDPTRASFVFAHGLVLAEAGHSVQIFLTGEATYTMRKATVDAILPIGWPPLSQTMEKLVARHIPVFS